MEKTDKEKGTGEKERQAGHMARRLKQYLPWLFLLLGVDGFAALLLWIADVEAFRALSGVLCLASLIFFAAVCVALVIREQGRESAFLAFLETPDEYHEQLLLKVVGAAWTDQVRLLGMTLREKQNAYGSLQSQITDYEEYVEAWAHETKIPLSLLTLIMDNRREELPGAVVFRLDYIRNRLQECIDQMLFYARLKGAHKDYLFEYVDMGECIEEVLEDYHPLLEEKQFRIAIRDGLEGAAVYTDRRGLRFILQQAVSNAVKYSREEPELAFTFVQDKKSCTLSIRDNGAGVPACDLPYIFEKGFTGESGQDRKKATGMGLYLAKEIARDLGLVLEAGSSFGKGFELEITFPVVSETLRSDT